MQELMNGFSKLSKERKIELLKANIPAIKDKIDNIKQFWHEDEALQKRFDEFSENTISNYYLPFGIAPNFLINGETFNIPMVTEESSVVAAASKAAKFWVQRGGFKAKVHSVKKIGHVHFIYNGEKEGLIEFFKQNKQELIKSVSSLTANMEKRGGGIMGCELIDKRASLQNYFQIEILFNTCDAMGANFINSVLEEFARNFEMGFRISATYEPESEMEIIMSILSNYTPECLVTSKVSCPINDLGEVNGMDPQTFSRKFVRAVEIARIDRYRAVTHNKGILNGIDALVLATGNDFRAIEACAHAYASANGSYQSLSQAWIKDEKLYFTLTIPLSLGTVGGLTSLHPLARLSLDILGNPQAEKLMEITASLGLAQNFSAISSLVTHGIQKGHMKMHLLNILNQLGCSKNEVNQAKEYFFDKVVSYTAVSNFINSLRVSQ
ncbi:hydroxymethylglutaryl-CoA reductase, degradative [Bacteriovoracaceae bacterium]|nr:hydroxymethylglutaryl-CoA reductase, degradative [Bacteriovoracaceae bacterium]